MGMTARHFASLGPHGFHRIAYTDWGGASNPHVVMCMHGLTRNSRDFDWLARALQRDCRVVCMDVAGRGESDWLEHKEDYTFRQYQTDAAALIARVTALERWPARRMVRCEPVRGRADGGLDRHLHGRPDRHAARRSAALADPQAGAQRRRPVHLLGLAHAHQGLHDDAATYPTLEEAQAVLRQACASWGPMSDEQWRHFARHSIRQNEEGFGFACDPRIADATSWGFSPDARVGNRNLMGLELWSVWEQVRCPVLILRGQGLGGAAGRDGAAHARPRSAHRGRRVRRRRPCARADVA